MPTAPLRVPLSPSLFPPSQIGIEKTLLPPQTSTSISPSDVNPISDTGPIDWGTIEYDPSSEEAQTAETGEDIQTLAEKELQAAH